MNSDFPHDLPIGRYQDGPRSLNAYQILALVRRSCAPTVVAMVQALVVREGAIGLSDG